MKKTVVIFGGGGQDGFYLNELLLSLDYQVIVFTHSNRNIGLPLDVSDFNSVKAELIKYKPEIIFHLAAKSSTQHKYLFKNHRAIVEGALNILEVVDRLMPKSKVFIASSALIFQNKGTPIKECNELFADTAYSLARIEALHVARYFRKRGLKVYVGFLFNHESPLRPTSSVVRKVARGVLDIHYGQRKMLNVGNFNVIKEWMWAGDAVAAMMVLISQDDIFEACIGDGIGRSIHDYAIACSKVVGLSLKERIVKNPTYEPEYSILVSGSRKIKSLGWSPKSNMMDLAKKMIVAEIANQKHQDSTQKKM